MAVDCQDRRVHDRGALTASCLRQGRRPCAGPAAPRIIDRYGHRLEGCKVVIVSVPLAMGLDPGDDFWPDVCACLAPDQYSEMLQPNSNLAWILNDAHTRCRHRVDTRFD